MVRDPSCSHTNNDITNRPLIGEPMPFTFSIEEEETDLECPKTLLLAFSPNRYLIVSESEYTIEVKSSAYSRLRYPLRGPSDQESRDHRREKETNVDVGIFEIQIAGLFRANQEKCDPGLKH
ncbi:hypothetical protein V1478_010442 [Vespula squamosa]|uniref:Uncharacterized protein n=1 Tax=Vespula squamosa TaxID=30214 RepID=A0ABD2AHS9_VESSQ